MNTKILGSAPYVNCFYCNFWAMIFMQANKTNYDSLILYKNKKLTGKKGSYY